MARVHPYSAGHGRGAKKRGNTYAAATERQDVIRADRVARCRREHQPFDWIIAATGRKIRNQELMPGKLEPMPPAIRQPLDCRGGAGLNVMGADFLIGGGVPLALDQSYSGTVCGRIISQPYSRRCSRRRLPHRTEGGWAFPPPKFINRHCHDDPELKVEIPLYSIIRFVHQSPFNAIHHPYCPFGYSETPLGWALPPHQEIRPRYSAAELRSYSTAAHDLGISNRNDDILDHCWFAWNKLIDMPWKNMSIGMRVGA
jgi:hypothetical protein